MTEFYRNLTDRYRRNFPYFRSRDGLELSPHKFLQGGINFAKYFFSPVIYTNMASENSEMRITKKHLNEATISLHQGSLNESSGLHDCSHNRAPDENVSPLSTPYSAQRRFGKLPANCRTPILYYIDYVSHSSTPYSAQRRFGMLPADYRTPKPVSYYIDYVPSPSHQRQGVICLTREFPILKGNRYLWIQFLMSHHTSYCHQCHH